MAREKSGTGKLLGVAEEKAAALEALRLTRRYVVQETIGPFKSLAKRAGLGVAGAVLLGIGLVVLLLGLLRVLQTETGTVFAGSWSFAPYLLTLVGAGVVAGIAVVVGLRAGRPGRG